MIRKFNLLRRIKSIIFITLTLGCFSSVSFAQSENEKAQIIKTGEVIREAFAREDIETIKSLHHPDVVKALAYNNLQEGREAVLNGLKTTLENYNLKFVENDIESILIQGDIAIEQTHFVIRGTPKNGGESFTFKGRTMVTYVRYAKSPTGWASIREIIQPAND